MEQEIDMLEVGERIKKARKDLNMTQDDLSKETEIAITQLSSYENGKKAIGLQSLYRISLALGKTMDELYAGPSSKKPISKSKNKGELIVNCVSALVDEGVIQTSQVQQTPDHFYEEVGCYSQTIFVNYLSIIDDLVERLSDFSMHKKDYPDPKNFKKQLMAAAAKQINDSIKR